MFKVYRQYPAAISGGRRPNKALEACNFRLVASVFTFMKKIVIRVVALGTVLLVLAIVGLILLTEQPEAPAPEYAVPQGRDEAWHQDIAHLRDEFLRVDRSFTEETSRNSWIF